jgi:hypothetical protein
VICAINGPNVKQVKINYLFQWKKSKIPARDRAPGNISHFPRWRAEAAFQESLGVISTKYEFIAFLLTFCEMIVDGLIVKIGELLAKLIFPIAGLRRFGPI